jgi:hypothetical protein
MNAFEFLSRTADEWDFGLMPLLAEEPSTMATMAGRKYKAVCERRRQAWVSQASILEPRRYYRPLPTTLAVAQSQRPLPRPEVQVSH